MSHINSIHAILENIVIFDNDESDIEDESIVSLASSGSSEKLYHELLINPDLISFDKINDNDLADIPKFIEVFGNDINILTEELGQQPPIYNKLLHILLFFRNTVNKIILSDERILNIINEEEIQILINENRFNIIIFKDIINNFIHYIKNFIIIDCENELINNWTIISENIINIEIINYPEVYKQVLEFSFYNLNILKINLSYRRLHQIIPLIRNTGYKYEIDKFQQKLNANTISLNYTKIVIESIIIKESNQNLLFSQLVINYDKQTFNTIYNYIVINIISNITKINTDICPETLLMDIKKLKRLQQEFKYIITASVILTQLSNYLISNNLDLNILNIIGNYLLSENNNVKYDKLLSNIYDLILLENKNDIIQILLDCNNNNNVINKLFIKKLGNYYNSLLLNNDSDYNYIITAKILAPRIKKNIPLMSKIIEITKNVHNDFYIKIIKEILHFPSY